MELIDVFDVKWPQYDEKMIKEDKINLVIQINGKKRNLIEVEPDKTEEELFKIIKKDEKIAKYIQNNQIKKKIYIKNKLINIII